MIIHIVFLHCIFPFVEQCQNQYGTIVSLVLHKKRDHPGFNAKKCQRCDFTTTSDKLKSHLKVCAQGEKLYDCGILKCESKFGSKKSRSIHRKQDHDQQIYLCESCDYKTTTAVTLKYHSKVCGK